MQITFKDRHVIFPEGYFDSRRLHHEWEYDFGETWIVLKAPFDSRGVYGGRKVYYIAREAIMSVMYEQDDPHGPTNAPQRLRRDYRSGVEPPAACGCGSMPAETVGPATGTSTDAIENASGSEQAESSLLHSTFGEDVPQPPSRGRGRPRKTVG